MLRALDLVHKRDTHVSINALFHLLQGCINKQDLTTARRVQQLIIRSGLQSNSFLASHLIRMFTLCGSLLEASQAFTRVYDPSPYAWAAIILAHANLGQAVQAIELYYCMLQSNLIPSSYCYVAVLKACINAAVVEEGKVIHNHIIQDGLDSDMVVNNTLIDMYVKLGSLTNALRVFKNSSEQSVVAWTAMISGYSQHGHTAEAFQLYQQMQQKDMEPNDVTFVSILKACSRAAEGRLIYAHVIERGLESSVFIGNTLIDMYTGSLEDALYVFDHLPRRDVVTWSALIAGYAQQGCGQEAIWLFQKMQQEVEPNRVTYVNVVGVCSILESLGLGKLIHGSVVEKGFESDTLLGTSLIDMYAKCGSFEDAHTLFKALPNRNVVTWTTMIAGYALHNDLSLALKCFDDMQKEGLKPNEATFLSLLSACSHLGLVHEGYHLFEFMTDQGVKPTVEHYYCMVDILGRAGCLKQAAFVLQSMPSIGSHAVGLRSLLSHCKTHGNMEIARHIFNQVATED